MPRTRIAVACHGSPRPRPAPAAAQVSRASVATLLLLAVCGGPGVLQARALDFGAGIATTYDDNILNYSGRDLFAFQYRLNPPRYAIETTDDLVTASYVEATWARDSTRATTVLARIEAERFATNRIRNNGRALLQWRARPFRRWRLTVAGSYVPGYYTRRAIDYDASVPYPELSRYRDARYRQAEGSANAEWRSSSGWRSQLGYSYARRDYRDAFPERDQNRHLLRLTIRPPRARALEARLRGSCGRALARGPQGDVGSGRPDVSSESFGTELALAWSPRIRDLSVTLQQVVDYEDRRYTTRDATDASRFGRSLHELDLEWELAWAFSSHWEVAAGYNRIVQRLSGDLSNVETFTDAGSYERNRVTARLGWSSRRSRTE